MKCNSIKFKVLFTIVLFAAFSFAAIAHAEPEKVLEGTDAPVFSGVDFKDKAFNLADHLLKRPIVINFLSTRCVSCLSVVKRLEKYRIENKITDEILFVYVSLDDWKKVVRIPPVWAKVFNKGQLLLNDGSRIISKIYEVDTLPSTLIIGKDGKILYRRDDYNKFFDKEIQEELDAHLVK